MTFTSVTETERSVLQAHREVAAGTARLLDLVAELDEHELHDDYQSASAWLSWNLGLSARTARRWVKLSRALRDHPLLRKSFAVGEISLDQVRLLVRIAAEHDEGFLLELARNAGDADDLRKEIKALEQKPGFTEPEDPAPEPFIRRYWTGSELVLSGSVPGAQGALVDKAFRLLETAAPRDAASGVFRDPEVLAGEALVQMASESLAGHGNPDRATIVVQIAAEELVAEAGPSWNAATKLFSPDELRQMACDARLQPALEDSDGVTVGVGRTTRKIPAWLRRLLEERDEGCRFPGCWRTRWLHAHHIVAWSQGGPTNLDNLVLLCGFHHRLIHRDGWTIEGNPNHELRFYNRFGLLHTPAKDRFPPNWVQHLAESAEITYRRQLEQLANPPP